VVADVLLEQLHERVGLLELVEHLFYSFGSSAID
jgi:hypothetical protein